MLPRVQLKPAGLRERHDQASSEAATHQDSHNAEVEYHGGARIIVLDARHTGVSNHGSSPLLLFLLLV